MNSVYHIFLKAFQPLFKIITFTIKIPRIPFGFPIVAFGLVLVIFIAGVSGAFYLNNPEKSQSATVLEEVSKIVSLPSETPSIATVNDPEKLKQNQKNNFFDNAQKGDILLIFNNAKKALLYRSLTKQIIEYASIGVEVPSATSSAEISTTAKTKKFVLSNGTTTAGLARDMEPEVEDKIEGAEVIARENAEKSDYKETLLIDLTGQRARDAKEYAEILKFKVGSLPEGEVKPEGADFLIIIGEDRAD